MKTALHFPKFVDVLPLHVFVSDTKTNEGLFVCWESILFMRVRDKEWWCFCLFIVATCVCERGQYVPEGIPAVTQPGLKHN